MAKRFADTEIWQKEWFLKLSLKCKMLVKFLFDNCDCAGIYEPNFTLLSFYIGEQITEKDFEEIKQVRKLENGNYFIEDFIKFQYNTTLDELNPKFSVHKGIIKQLEKNNITLTQPLPNPLLEVSQPLQDMVMDKDKDNKSKDIICNLDFEKCFKIYSENCKQLLPLHFERRSRAVLEELNQFLKEIDYDFEYFLSLCKKSNELKRIVESKIDFRSMIRNHIGIMNGKYETKKQTSRGVSSETIQRVIAEARKKQEANSG